MHDTLQHLRRRILIVVGCIVALLAVTLPATASNQPRTGEQISLLPYSPPPSTFAADTPFYIEHGWGVCIGPGAMDVCSGGEPSYVGLNQGKSDFQLYLDGVLQPSTLEVRNDVPFGSWEGPTLSRFHLTNHPSGLPADTYTFRGVWTLDGAVELDLPVTITFS